MSVTTTPNPVPEHESLQLIVVVDSGLSNPVGQPTFDAPDFTVMGAPGLNFVPQNGDEGPNTRKKLTFTFVLMPKKAGDFVIRNIHSRAGNQQLTSPDMNVKVTADNGPRPAPTQPGTRTDDDASNPASPNYNGNPFNNSAPPNPASPPSRSAVTFPDRFNSDFTVWASLNKTKAYVGEPIVVEYYLYDFGGLRQSEILQWPTFTGFWKEDLELTTHVNFEDIYLKQQEMRRAFISRYAIYGIKPGIITVDKLGIRGKYVSPTQDPRALFGYDTRTGQHYSQDVTVEILPLPEAGRPDKFSGAVGRFNLKLEADKLSLPQNTPITFTFTLTGAGNFQAIDSIKLPLPTDFELYEQTASGRTLAPVGIKQELESKKTFQVVAIPRKAGKFEVAPISWSFFNTEKQAYETLATPALAIEVLPNEAGSGGANSYLGPRDPKTGAASSPPEEFRGLKPVEAYEKKSPIPGLNLLLWILLALNLALAFRYLRARTRGLYQFVKGMDKFSEARILLLQAKGIKDSEWQAGLEEVVLMTMQVLLETNPRGLTKSDLEDMWKSRDLPAPLFLRASALLEEIDRHRFSSQKLTGSGTKEVRSRLTKETESLLTEASLAKRK